MQYNSPSGQYLAQDGHCIFEETSHQSNNSIFPNFWMVFLGSSLNVWSSSVFFRSAMTDSVRVCVLSVCTKSSILDTLPSSSTTAFCGTPCKRRSILKRSPSAHDCSLLERLSCCTCQTFFKYNSRRRSRRTNPLVQNLVSSGAYHFFNAVSWH